MIKKILAIILVLAAICSLMGCSLFKKEEPLYNIKLNDPNDMVDDIPKQAKAGETVTIRIDDRVAASAIVKIKNVEVTRKENGTNKWIFTFVMPDHDIKVDILIIQDGQGKG